MGLREALSWIKNLGFNRVIFESDLLQVAHALQKRVADVSEFGVLIKDCFIPFARSNLFFCGFYQKVKQCSCPYSCQKCYHTCWL